MLHFLAASVASQLCGCQCDDLATLWTVIRQPAATLSPGSVNYKDAQTQVNLPQVVQKSKQRGGIRGRVGRGGAACHIISRHLRLHKRPQMQANCS